MLAKPLAYGLAFGVMLVDSILAILSVDLVGHGWSS
jgi:hypothetical protein